MSFAHNFLNLEFDSRLEIAFEGKPRGFEAPSYKVFTNETSGMVIFDIETRVIERFIAPDSTIEIQKSSLQTTSLCTSAAHY
jgi:hypothetical protein